MATKPKRSLTLDGTPIPSTEQALIKRANRWIDTSGFYPSRHDYKRACEDGRRICDKGNAKYKEWHFTFYAAPHLEEFDITAGRFSGGNILGGFCGYHLKVMWFKKTTQEELKRREAQPCWPCRHPYFCNHTCH